MRLKGNVRSFSLKGNKFKVKFGKTGKCLITLSIYQFFYEIEEVFGLQNISFVAIILIVIEVW